ncbi:MAG: HD domain-containing phosphohydrolase, partial [Thermodesulfobacteriota bacterium]|nr:HD domain-containing phosphohydrolase [Thermodesulfobacteriota bacterium]
HTPPGPPPGSRVSALSRQVAVSLGLDEKDIVNIEIAGFLHDIGKLGLPKKIIDYNQQTWDEQEWALYQSHPEEGQSIVRFINKLDQVAILIRAHHERYDGGGFPDQLNEEAIPLGARIITVVDAYDRIANLKLNTQIYLDEYLKEKKLAAEQLPEEELTRQAAINHLKRGAFSIYDPDMVKAFLDVLKKTGVKNRMEKKLALDNLREGMVLSRSLYSRKGRFLLPHDTALTKEHIHGLKNIKPSDPVAIPVYVIVK